MAKQVKEQSKVTFGVRRRGKHSKRSGPKTTKTKQYRAQG